MLGLLCFRRACSLTSSKATLTTKATTFSSSSFSSSLVHSLPDKTFSSISKVTPQNQVLINPFHHHFLLPWRPSSQPTLAGKLLSFPAVLAKQVWYFTILNTHHLKASRKAQVDSRTGVKVSTFDLVRKRWILMFRSFKESSIILGLTIINVAILLMWELADNNFMTKNFTISVDNFINGRVHTLITSAFSHVNPGILICNMIGLATFGINLERIFGPAYLLQLYLAGAVCGSLFHLVHHSFLALSSQEQGERDPSKTPGLGIFLIMQDILRIMQGTSHISGSAHLGGAAVAAIEWSRIKKGRFF